MTVIQKAKELVVEVGKEKAIQYFKNRIVKPQGFDDIFNNSANEIAIEYIQKNL